MNLVELDKLISSLNPKTDKDLIIFYKKKRKDLTTNISSKINKELKSNKYANGGGIDESEIDELYKKSKFINDDFNWKLKLLEMLQDNSIEAYNIYQTLSKEQKEQVLKEQYEVDNDMGSDGDGKIKTTKENLKILLNGAKNGKKYANGGGVGKSWTIRDYNDISVGSYLDETKLINWAKQLSKENGENVKINSSKDAIQYIEKRDKNDEQNFEVYENYANGGSVERENAEMVLNNNKQISHHTKELASAVKGKKVPAWVVAKVNRSASDLSDATHYLDGSKYKKGGGVGNELTRGEIENKIDGLKLRIAKTKKQISTYENTNRGKYNNLWQEKVVPLQNELIELSELWGKSKYAKGGTTKGYSYTIGGL